MENSKETLRPNYWQIYTDMLNSKYPEKKEICSPILNKGQLSVVDIIELNKKIFSENTKNNQKYRSYSKFDILEILAYQKKERMNNTQLAKQFDLSKNTITKWKKLFF